MAIIPFKRMLIPTTIHKTTKRITNINKNKFKGLKFFPSSNKLSLIIFPQVLHQDTYRQTNLARTDFQTIKLVDQNDHRPIDYGN